MVIRVRNGGGFNGPVVLLEIGNSMNEKFIGDNISGNYGLPEISCVIMNKILTWIM